MTGTAPVLALLQAVEPEAEKGGTLLLGYTLVAAGVFDLLLALFFTLLRPVPDPKARAILGGFMAFSGLAMIVLGILFVFGTLGG